MRIILTRGNEKSVHISVNTRKVKYAMNETKYEEPLVADNSVSNTPSYFKLFECGKNILDNLDNTYEREFITTSQGKWDTVKLRFE